MAMELKTGSAFYPDEVIARARANTATHDWAAEARDAIVKAAEPWVSMTDDELWDLMFGPNIKRSWMVWSDGICPSCTEEVKMYTWEMHPWEHRFKVQCPHCKELFPKNDFDAFRRSGFDEHGVFLPELADRSLLFNAEHPDADDPLRLFGVDDGDGYVDGEGRRWRFIGAYLIYGHWKRLVVDGTIRLSAAYAATGDPKYAYKAAIIFDRVADVFPEFDFREQGIVYERQGDRGQVSTWHDACAEVHQMALAYDRIFEGARDQEDALVAYLSPKAEAHKLDNPKKSWEDIQRNIEGRIFRDTLANGERIHSNYPTTDVALLLIKTILDWPRNREEVLSLLDGIIVKATAVDGVSGEKGMAGYATISPRTLAKVLGQFSLLEPELLGAVYERHPVLHDTYRFHVDMWCMDEWYPSSGDSGKFGAKSQSYVGVSLPKTVNVIPSMWTFLWDMYKLTGDPALAQVIYNTNGNTVEGLPYDLFGEDPAAFQADVQAIIDREGPVIQRGSVNKEQWRLAILRSGEGENRRALWMDYDSHGAHSHRDGLNLGFYAKGLDIIPDFGYPPVGYGGWRAPKAQWYVATAAHATVVVDGKSQGATTGEMTMWADGDRIKAMRAKAPGMYGVRVYERAVALADLGGDDSYVLDCFFVSGGSEHAKFFQSYFGEVSTEGLSLVEAPEYGQETDSGSWTASLEMKNFRRDPQPEPGWSADWKFSDYHGYIPEGKDLHVRYTDLTTRAEACVADCWVDSSGYGGVQEWIPRLMVRRTSNGDPLTSTFVSVIEPYEGETKCKSIRRLRMETINGALLPDDFVCVEVVRSDEVTDIWMVTPGGAPLDMEVPEHNIHMRGEFACVSIAPDGSARVALAESQWIRIDKLAIVLKDSGTPVELALGKDGARLVSGDINAIDHVEVAQKEVRVKH